MKGISNFVKWFLYITTGILIICGVNYQLAGVEMVSVDVFWKILFSGFATTLVSVLLLPKEEDGKIKMYLKFGLHYAALCIVMIPLGCWFGWIDMEPSGIICMMLDVGGVYLAALFAYYIVDRKQADEINRMLKEKYGDAEQ